MYSEDLHLLCCPASHAALVISRVDETAPDGEILRGELRADGPGHTYPIENGIPRFVANTGYNRSWDYKWTRIDQGRGLNYRILDKQDPAYRIHDIFDRNAHGGMAFEHARARLALDIGCGVGQYTIKLLKEIGPSKVVSMDLTGGVDLFRAILFERFPEYRRRVLLVQASVFDMPFCDESFDYVFSLGVLMHTGDTRQAIAQAARVVKDRGQMNIWVYCPLSIHLDVNETGRKVPMTLWRALPYWFMYAWAMLQIRLFRHLPHATVVAILKGFSSEPWYRLCRLPVLGLVFRAIFGTVMHPDRDYRYINNYDGWCNNWADTWSENELFPTLREEDIVIRGISDWPTGIWGEKIKDFYR